VGRGEDRPIRKNLCHRNRTATPSSRGCTVVDLKMSDNVAFGTTPERTKDRFVGGGIRGGPYQEVTRRAVTRRRILKMEAHQNEKKGNVDTSWQGER